ncbi:hypothetical protein GCM10010174_16500 [Kutzneria viridogrisea]|uniref:DNA-binding beta-propeller fold protein YncE n=1 Tax=Kutzneria viridogrisea TaxID=47990 RepID=A0ABR6BDJ1_9PSEU|nr:DNA-binding beta-propeller fold protein YncE [Kutzneria viridogrisea]
MLISSNQRGSTVTVLDDELTEVARLAVPAQPHVLVHDESRDRLYATVTYRNGFYDKHGDLGHEIVVIDPGTWEITEVVDIAPYAGPHDLAVDGDRLHVVCESHGGCLLTLDLNTWQPLGHVPTGTAGPHWLALTGDRTKAYTGNKEAGFVSVLDLVDRRMAGRIAMPTGSEDLEVRGDLLYAADRARALLHVVDTGSDEKVGEVELPGNPLRVHVLADGRVAVSHFHANWDSDESSPDSVSIVDVEQGKVVEQVQVGAGPLGMTSAGADLYVNNAKDGTMTVIDVRDWQVRATVPMDGGAHEIVYLER